MFNLPQRSKKLIYPDDTYDSYTHVLMVFVPIEFATGGMVTGQAYIEPLTVSGGWLLFDFDASLSALQKGHHKLFIYGQNSASNTDTGNATLLFTDEVYVENNPASGEVGAYDVETNLPPATLNAVDQNTADIDALNARVTVLESEPGGIDCDDVAECQVVEDIQEAVDENTALIEALDLIVTSLVVQTANNSASFAHLRASGVAGGDLDAETWTVVNLNAKMYEDIGLGLSFDAVENEITIPAGKWSVRAMQAGYKVGRMSLCLVDASDDSPIANLTSMTGANADPEAQVLLAGAFELTEATAVRLLVRGDITQAVFGQGYPNSHGNREIHATLELTKRLSTLDILNPSPTPEPPTVVNLFSLDFNGVNEQVLLTGLTMPVDAPWTIMLWYKRTSTSNNVEYIFSTLPSSGGNGIILWANSQSFRFAIVPNTGGATSYTTAAGTVTGDWQHIAITYDGSETYAGVKLYVNGVFLVGSAAGAFAAGTTFDGDTFRLGSFAGGSFWANMLLDEFAILDAELTTQQVQEAYGNGAYVNLLSASAFSASDSVTHYYRCDDERGDQLTDAVTPAINGTLVNMDSSNYNPDIHAVS